MGEPRKTQGGPKGNLRFWCSHAKWVAHGPSSRVTPMGSPARPPRIEKAGRATSWRAPRTPLAHLHPEARQLIHCSTTPSSGPHLLIPYHICGRRQLARGAPGDGPRCARGYAREPVRPAGEVRAYVWRIGLFFRRQKRKLARLSESLYL